MRAQDKKDGKILAVLIAATVLAIILVSLISTGHLVLK